MHLISRIIIWIFVEGISIILGQEPECVNIFAEQSCNSWALQGECTFNPVWMVENCRLACHACVEYECVNLHNNESCNTWASEGECEQNPWWMTKNCRLACHACADFGCFDEQNLEANCVTWALDSKCTPHQNYQNLTKLSCQRSCGNCTHLSRLVISSTTDVHGTYYHTTQNVMESFTVTVEEASGEDEKEVISTVQPTSKDLLSEVYDTSSGEEDSSVTPVTTDTLDESMKVDTTIPLLKTSTIVIPVKTESTNMVSSVQSDLSIPTESYLTTVKLETETFSEEDSSTKSELDSFFTTKEITTDKLLTTTEVSGDEYDFSSVTQILPSSVSHTFGEGIFSIETVSGGDQVSSVTSVTPVTTDTLDENIKVDTTIPLLKTSTIVMPVKTDSNKMVSSVKSDLSVPTASYLTTVKLETETFSGAEDETASGVDDFSKIFSTLPYPTIGDMTSTHKISTSQQQKPEYTTMPLEFKTTETASGKLEKVTTLDKNITTEIIAESKAPAQTTVIAASETVSREENKFITSSGEAMSTIFGETVMSTTSFDKFTTLMPKPSYKPTTETITKGVTFTYETVPNVSTSTYQREGTTFMSDSPFTETIQDSTGRKDAVTSSVSETASGDEQISGEETTTGEILSSTLKTSEHPTLTKLDVISETSQIPTIIHEITTIELQEEISETASGEELVSTTKQYPKTTEFKQDMFSKTSQAPIAHTFTATKPMAETLETASGDELFTTFKGTEQPHETTQFKLDLISITSETVNEILDETTETASGEEIYSTLKPTTVKLLDETTETASGEEMYSTLKPTTVELLDETTETASGEEMYSTLKPTTVTLLDETTETASGEEMYSTLKPTTVELLDETTETASGEEMYSTLKPTTVTLLDETTETASGKETYSTLKPTTVKLLDETTETASGEEIYSTLKPTTVKLLDETTETVSGEEMYSTLKPTTVKLLDETTETAPGKEMYSTLKPTTVKLLDETTETASGEEIYSTLKPTTVKLLDETNETASGELSFSTGKSKPLDETTETTSGEELFSTLQSTTVKLLDETTETSSGENELLLSTIFPTSDVMESISGEEDVTKMVTGDVSRLTTISTMVTTEFVASPVIYFSNENNILKRENGLISSLINQDNGNIVGLAVDSETNALFWSNNAYNYKGIYRSSLNGTGVERMISSDVYEVNGLAVDPSAKLLFWTDAQRKCIKISRYDGQTVKTIIRKGLKTPRGIAIDTINSYIYWNDQGTRKIERSKFDGSSRETVFEGDQIYWPNQMTISKDGMQLMWVDAWLQNLNILNTGSKMLKTIDLSSQTDGSPAFGLTVLGAKAYITIWGDTKLVVVDLQTQKMDVLNNNLGNDVLFSIAVDDDTSKVGFHPCQTNNGGCSHLCLPTGQSTLVCTCPDTGGLLLSSDNKTCQSPAEFLLFGRIDTGEVMMMPSGQSISNSNVAVIGRSSRPVGVAYDPITQRVYWSDVQDRQIYSSRLGGQVKDVFLNSSQGLGFVEGLFLDWQHRKLYFTNTDFVTIDGTAFSWHKIEVIDLDTMARRQIVTNVNQPRGLYVDSVNGHIYYTDIDDDEPKVMRCNLDGREVKTIMTKAQDIQVPNDVMYKNGQLYVVDSYYKYQESGDTSVTGKLFSINPINVSLLKIISESLKVPFAMTMSGDKIYVSDWGRRAILEVHPSTGQITEVLSDIDEATGILYTVKKEIYNEIVEAPCNATCSGLCLKEDASLYDCVCDTYHLSWTASTKIQQCSASENFVIVSDLNAIKYKAIEEEGNKDITDTYVLHEGNKYFSSFVALDYDKSNKIVYYSDVNRGTIENYNLISKETTIMYKGPEVINDLMITSSHMYWASESTGCIKRAPLHNMQLMTDIVCNLNQPRSLALANVVGYLYWSELGPQPSVWRSRIDGTGRRKVWSENGSIPNSLFFESNRFAIYILDSGNNKIVECNLDGSFCVNFLTLPGNGPYFGLQKQGNFIYYSDWSGHSIMMHEFKEKFSKVLVGNLIRPSRFVVIHPRAISDNCRKSECTDQCKAYPGGYICKCFDGRKQINKLTCISDQGTTDDHDLPLNMTTAQPFINMTTVEAAETSSASSMDTTPFDTASKSSTGAVPVVDQDTIFPYVTTESSPFTEATSGSTVLPLKTEDVKTPPTKTTKYETKPEVPTSSTQFVSVYNTTPSKFTERKTKFETVSQLEVTTSNPQITSKGESSTSYEMTVGKTEPQIVNETKITFAPSTVEITQPELTTEKVATMSTKFDKASSTFEKTTQLKLKTIPIFEATSPTEAKIIGPTTESTLKDTTIIAKHTSQREATGTIFEETVQLETTVGKVVSTTAEKASVSTAKTLAMTRSTKLPVETVTTAIIRDKFTTGVPQTRKTIPIKTNQMSTITKAILQSSTSSKIPETVTSGKTVTLRTDRSSTVKTGVQETMSTKRKPVTTVTPKVIVTTPDQGLLTTLSPISPRLIFLYCPDNMNVYAFGNKKQVWWKEPAVIPEPYVTDQVEVLSNYVSGDQLPLGRVEVVYTAVLKSYGKEANCTFYVNVTKQEFVCSPTPVVQNGDLQCDHTNFIYGCKAKCDEGFLNTYDTTYVCKSSGWEPVFPAGYAQLACKRKVTNSTSVDIVITFNGPCTQISSPEFQNTFKEQITSILKTSGICSVENLYQFCNSQLYSLQCDSGLRKKRAINTEKIKLLVKIWYPNSDPPTSQIYAALKPLEDIINAGIVEVSLQNNNYIASSVIAYINNVTQCPPGSILANNDCVLCPIGSYYKASATTCEPCASGYYQGYEGQDFCEKCPGSSITDAGAFLAKQCKSRITDKTTEEPTDTRDNKILPLVIGLSVVGGLLFLAAIALAAYTCLRVFRRKKGEILFDHEKMAAKYKNRLYSHSAFGAIAHTGEDFRNGKNKAMPQYKGIQKKYHVDKYHPPPKVRIQTRSPTGSLEKSPHRNNNIPRNYSNPKSWTPSPTGSLDKSPIKTPLKPEEYVIVSPYPISQKKPPVRKMVPVMDKYEMKRMKVGKSHGGAKPRSPSSRVMQTGSPGGGVYVKRRQEPPRYYMVESTGWRGLSETEKATH